LYGTDSVVWTIANEAPERLRALREREGYEMPILLDPEVETIKAYGVYNWENERMVPHPTAVIVDKQGTVRYVRVDVDYKLRPSVAELLEALDGM